VVDYLRLARDAIATNTPHAGIILVPPSLRGDELQVIADAIVDDLKRYSHQLDEVVLYLGTASERSRP
jgi:hypothetical protein